MAEWTKAVDCKSIEPCSSLVRIQPSLKLSFFFFSLLRKEEIFLSKMNSIGFFQNMKQFFIKKGKKHSVESLFKSLLILRAKNNKKETKALLSNCMLNASPFVALKMRKRGKRTTYKVNFLDEKKGERKALIAFSKATSSKFSGRFAPVLEKELEDLANGKSPISTKRDEIHRIALENAPYG